MKRNAETRPCLCIVDSSQMVIPFNLPWCMYWRSNTTRGPCFTPFCRIVPCQCTPLLNLRFLIFGLKSFGWLRFGMLICAYSMVSYGNIIFNTRPLFQEHNETVKEGLGVFINKTHCFTIQMYGSTYCEDHQAVVKIYMPLKLIEILTLHSVIYKIQSLNSPK